MSERRLAAIMFTDIVGYTALMGKDEKKAFECLKKNRRIQWRLIKKFKGKWLKEMGDGILASFSSNIDAVMCAVSIQTAAEEMYIPLRIGIHLGDVIFEEKDVLGDGVNVASRIQGTAETNGIVISETVFNDIKNKEGIDTEFLGTQTLKGVESPIGVYKVTCKDLSTLNFKIDTGELTRPIGFRRLTIAAWILVIAALAFILYLLFPEYFGPAQDIKKSIAVLPFVNMTNDSTQEYFSDGITEEIISNLSNIKDLSVRASASVFQYKNSSSKPSKIGEDLGVTYLLAGSVRRELDMVRITIKLINARTETQVWAENYDRKYEGILKIQSEVAKKVAELLNITLSTPEKERIERMPTTQYTAYDYYLRALKETGVGTAEGERNALEYLDKAIELDPEYSKAYSLYAHRLMHLSVSKPMMSTQEALKLALPAAEKAVEFDSLSSDAWFVLGVVKYYLEWNFLAAEKYFLKSMELKSWGDAPIYGCFCTYAEYLLSNEREDEVRILLERITKIDPLNIEILGIESWIYSIHDEHEKALELFEEFLLRANRPLIYMGVGMQYHLMGDYEKAIQYYESGLSRISRSDLGAAKILARLAMSYYRLERIEETFEILDELIERHENGEYGLAIPIALIFNEMEDEENTFKWLDIVYEQRESNFLYLRILDFKNLRDHPRYIALMRKIGFDI